MPKPFITALIDTFNHERFIQDAIRSVLQQNFPSSDLEILVVDDGSTDRTPEIVRGFEPRVRLLRKVNGGQASAFNVGISEARGEILAFLDGDDWWAPRKLTAVVDAFASNPAAGLVGHGIAIVRSDGSQYTEVPREFCRFRITTRDEARMFHTRRIFLGASRMAYRKEILRQIGPVPEALKFEADEYFSALAGFFSDVAVLPASLAFYRLHGNNLYQQGNASPEAARSKQQVLASLSKSLSEKMKELKVPNDIAKIIVQCVQAEADVLRLSLESGYPWETVSAEWTIHRALHRDASLPQHLFTLARLIPAFVMPAAAYYRCRRRLAASPLYRKLKGKLLPFPVPRHVEHSEKPDEANLQGQN